MRLRTGDGVFIFLQTHKTINNKFFYKIKSVQPINLLFNTFLIIISRFLVKRFFKQQIAESVKMWKFTTPTGIIIMIVKYTIIGSKSNWYH